MPATGGVAALVDRAPAGDGGGQTGALQPGSGDRLDSGVVDGGAVPPRGVVDGGMSDGGMADAGMAGEVDVGQIAQRLSSLLAYDGVAEANMADLVAALSAGRPHLGGLLAAYRRSTGASLVDDLARQLSGRNLARASEALGVAIEPAPEEERPVDGPDPMQVIDQIAAELRSLAENPEFEQKLLEMLTDEARELIGFPGREATEAAGDEGQNQDDEGGVNLRGAAVYALIDALSSMMYFRWLYGQNKIDQARAAGQSIDVEATRATAMTRATVQVPEVASRGFATFVLADMKFFKDPTWDAAFKTSVGVLSVEALHSVFNAVVQSQGHGDWKMATLLRSQRQAAALVVPLIGQARSYLHQEGVLEQPGSDTDGKREYLTIEGWTWDNLVLWVNLSIGVSVSFGIGEALAAGEELTGDLVRRFKPLSWRHIPNNLVKGVKPGLKIARGNIPALTIGLVATILKSSSIADLEHMDQSDPKVQLLQAFFSIDDLTDAALELVSAAVDVGLHAVEQLVLLLAAYPAAAIEAVVDLMKSVLLGEAADPETAIERALRQLNDNDEEHEAALAEHRQVIVAELLQAVERWGQIGQAWAEGLQSEPRPSDDAEPQAPMPVVPVMP